MLYERRIMEGSLMTDLWVLEFARGVSTRLTSEGMGYLQDAGWSADGESVYYTGRDLTIYRKAVLGASEAELILDGGKGGILRDLSASGDGGYLMYAHTATQRPGDAHLWVVPLQGPKEARKPFVFLQTKFGERSGRFIPSAKGTPRWVAYTSAESGRDEIYVRAFDPANRTGRPAGEKWQVSRDGGTEPRWRGDGKELFFVGLDGMVMVADVLASEGPVFRTGPAKALFQSPAGVTERFARLGDVSSDGKRFLFGVPEKEEGDKPFRRMPLRVMVNWQAGLGKE
jgi:Tol biopolymer transport system component